MGPVAELSGAVLFILMAHQMGAGRCARFIDEWCARSGSLSSEIALWSCFAAVAMGTPSAMMFSLNTEAAAPPIAVSVFAAIECGAFCAFLRYLGFNGRGNYHGNLRIAGPLMAGMFMCQFGVAAMVVAGTAMLPIALLMIFIYVRSDLRSLRPSGGGVGLFLGTFNPIHRTHLAMVRYSLWRHGLRHVYIQPTGVPPLHRDALARRELRLGPPVDGRRVYAPGPRAKSSKQYFPTGNEFYEYEDRVAMIEAAIARPGLEGRVSVLNRGDIYEDGGGFPAIIAHVLEENPSTEVHIIHGSDLGGMWIARLAAHFSRCGRLSFRRRSRVSATSIRRGEWGLTVASVRNILTALRNGESY